MYIYYIHIYIYTYIYILAESKPTRPNQSPTKFQFKFNRAQLHSTRVQPELYLSSTEINWSSTNTPLDFNRAQPEFNRPQLGSTGVQPELN